MNALRVYRHGLEVGYRDFRDFWSLRSWAFGWMLRILTNAFVWMLLGRLTGSEERVRYLLVGNAMAVGAAAALWASNATTWPRYDGSHAFLVIAPSGLVPAVLGRTSIWLYNGVATSLASFAVLLPIFGVRLPLGAALWLPVLVILVCASAFSFALFMGALLSNRRQWRNMALDIGGMVLLAICGVSVPLSFWPAPVQWLASVLPLTHGLAAARMLLAGVPAAEAMHEVVRELLVLVFWLTLGLSTMQRLFNGGRSDGSIELT